MNEYESTNPRRVLPERARSSATPMPPVAAGPGRSDAVAPFPVESTPGGSASVEMARQTGWPRVRRLLPNRKIGRIVAAAVLAPVIGLSVGLATSSSASAAQPVSGSATPGGHGSAGGGSNARSGPAAGGASGRVATVSRSGFTITTVAGQMVTVDETTSTKYLKGKSSTSASAIKKATNTLVLGTTSGTTIKATQVIVQTTGAKSATSSASKVVAFQSGTPTISKTVGQIPASYKQGSGTIVSGTTANKATEAALAAYPGGIVDRVVKLSNGEYEVHYIGVNWPHHVFVNKDFKVVGAN